MDNETKAIEALTREMELTRLEMAALTDAISRLHHSMNSTATETANLAKLIDDVSKRGFWRRLLG